MWDVFAQEGNNYADILDIGETGGIAALLLYLVWQIGVGKNGNAAKHKIRDIDVKMDKVDDGVHELKEMRSADSEKISHLEDEVAEIKQKVEHIEEDIYRPKGRRWR